MDMEDYEKQEELKRANQLFSESNNLQKKTIRSTRTTIFPTEETS